MTPEKDTLPAGMPATGTEEPVWTQAEITALATEFPQFDTPAALPAEVTAAAQREHISLLDAYLRYRWQEEKRVTAAAKQRQAAAAASVGPLSRGAVAEDTEPDAFLRAFRSAL